MAPKCDVGNCIFSKSWEFLKILWEFFSYGRKWFVCKDFGFCQDFVSMHKEEGRRSKFRSLEERETSSSHLKNYLTTIHKSANGHYMLNKYLFTVRLESKCVVLFFLKTETILYLSINSAMAR